MDGKVGKANRPNARYSTFYQPIQVTGCTEGIYLLSAKKNMNRSRQHQAFEMHGRFRFALRLCGIYEYGHAWEDIFEPICTLETNHDEALARIHYTVHIIIGMVGWKYGLGFLLCKNAYLCGRYVCLYVFV